MIARRAAQVANPHMRTGCELADSPDAKLRAIEHFADEVMPKV